LYLIGAINLVILIGIIRVFRRMRAGHYDEEELEAQLGNRGVMNRIYARATRAVKEPWHMYPLGVLFGFGFDTATEVALLVLAALDLNTIGFVIVALVVCTWAAALAVWRFGRIEERWSAGLRSTPPTPPSGD